MNPFTVINANCSSGAYGSGTLVRIEEGSLICWVMAPVPIGSKTLSPSFNSLTFEPKLLTVPTPSNPDLKVLAQLKVWAQKLKS